MKNFPGVNDRILYLIDSQLGGNKKKFAEKNRIRPSSRIQYCFREEKQAEFRRVRSDHIII